jgi:aminopeptidase N
MKNLLLTFCFACSFVNLFAQQSIDVLHYRYEIELTDNNDTIYGKAAITVKFLQPAASFRLDINRLGDNGKGMIIDRVTGRNTRGYSNFADSINILFLPQDTPAAGDTATYFVNYHGIPADGLIISKNKYGQRTFFADNWPNRGHNWLPCVDEPGDKASVEFIVTAPQHYQVISNGIQMEESNLSDNKKRTHYKEDVPVATKVMVIGVAEFATQLSGTVDNCIPIYSWVYPQDRDKGFYDYALAKDILPFFIKNVGPYGYKKLANVQSKTTFGGLENASAIFYAENSVSGTRRTEALLAHEIAHQWFGNMATEKKFAHLWLSEGFATYMTILYMQNKYGNDTARYMLNEDRQQIIAFAKQDNSTVVNETTDYMQLLNTNSYQKGGWILHMLRSQLGDSVFYRSIRQYYTTYAGKNADSKDLQQVFEKVSGKNLTIFFDQWLYKPGIPILDIKWKYAATEKKLIVTIKQTQADLFQFPLELATQTSTGKKKAIQLQVTKKEQEFKIATTEKIIQLFADPQLSLLFDGKIAATK